MVQLPTKDGVHRYALIERWIADRATELFPDREVIETFPFKIIRDADLRSEIGTITVPTLVIAGTHDPVTPPADAEQIRARINGARVALLETAHLANVELADDFTDLIVAFIEEQEQRHG